jgi:hypothetical protein
MAARCGRTKTEAGGGAKTWCGAPADRTGRENPNARREKRPWRRGCFGTSRSTDGGAAGDTGNSQRYRDSARTEPGRRLGCGKDRKHATPAEKDQTRADRPSAEEERGRRRACRIIPRLKKRAENQQRNSQHKKPATRAAARDSGRRHSRRRRGFERRLDSQP